MSKNGRFMLVAQSGFDVLVARRADIDAGNTNGDAWAYRNGTLYGPKPLQVWFKFGTWPDVSMPAEAAERLLSEVEAEMERTGSDERQQRTV